MKHLFIINPMAEKIKGKTAAAIEEITEFFTSHPHLSYDIHVSRWCRDSVGFARRYVSNAGEPVRIHVFGGTGTLFEVVNGVIGLPNAQIAAHPRGGSDTFLQYFGSDKTHLFASIRSQVFSDTIPIDAIRCGRNYSISFGLVGLEAMSNYIGDEWIAKTRLPADFCYMGAAVYEVYTNSEQLGWDYKVSIDGQCFDGRYVSLMIANQPCYGRNMCPAIDAHPNDGVFDVYMVKAITKLKLLFSLTRYTSGNYKRVPEIIKHVRGRKITIESELPACMNMDGETFFESNIEFELIPCAIDFVCPKGVDPYRLPRVYNTNLQSKR